MDARQETQGAAPNPKKPLPRWRYGDHVVAGHTKGEARAALKRLLNLDRLPVGAVITREG